MLTPEEAQAQQYIQLDGKDGFRAAAELVGPDRAAEFLAQLIRKEILELYGRSPTDTEVAGLVAEVRREKGY